MRTAQIIMIGTMAATLAGCATIERRGEPVVVQPSGVEGSWIDRDGVGVSTFAGGSFQTIDASTGSKLSEGSYRYADNRTVSIEVRSLIRQTVSSVNCALATPSQLNCTSSSGNQFVLVRRSATS